MGARELGIDRTEIRKRNYIPPDQFPHNHEIIYQDFAPLTYDSGNYAPALEKAKKMIGYDTFPAEQKRARAEGKHLGIGDRVVRGRHGHWDLTKGRASPLARMAK